MKLMHTENKNATDRWEVILRGGSKVYGVKKEVCAGFKMHEKKRASLQNGMWPASSFCYCWSTLIIVHLYNVHIVHCKYHQLKRSEKQIVTQYDGRTCNEN